MGVGGVELAREKESARERQRERQRETEREKERGVTATMAGGCAMQQPLQLSKESRPLTGLLIRGVVRAIATR